MTVPSPVGDKNFPLLFSSCALNSLTLKLSVFFTEKYVKFDEDNDLCKGCKLFQYINLLYLDYLNQILYDKQILLTLHVIFVMKEKYLSFFLGVSSLKTFWSNILFSYLKIQTPAAVSRSAMCTILLSTQSHKWIIIYICLAVHDNCKHAV